MALTRDDCIRTLAGSDLGLSKAGVSFRDALMAEAVGEFKAFTEKAREAALLDMSYEADVRDIPYMGAD